MDRPGGMPSALPKAQALTRRRRRHQTSKSHPMDDNGGASLSSSPSPSLSPSPSPSPSRSYSTRPIPDPLTVDAASRDHLALGISIDPSSSGGSGGGMEDPWSDGATTKLIEAWGERCVATGDVSLSHAEWLAVADVVSSRDGYSKPPTKTGVQCKRRINALQEKYKAGEGKSDSFFDIFHETMKIGAAPGKVSGSFNPGNKRATCVNFPRRTRTAQVTNPLIPGRFAIPIQEEDSSSGDGSGGGREDAWSDGATSTLIHTWGDRFVQLGRRSLLNPEWQEIADVVNSRDNYSKPTKTAVDCKSQMHILKKKYRAGEDKSGPFFELIDQFVKIGGAPVVSGSSKSHDQRIVPVLPLVSFPRRTRTRSGKRQCVKESANGADSSDHKHGLGDVAQAIRQFGEVFERVESSRREHELRMHRYRLNAVRELEEQRMQFFLNLQEISKGDSNIVSEARNRGRTKRKRDNHL